MRSHSKSPRRALVLDGSEEFPSRSELSISLPNHSDDEDDERLTASGKCYLATPPSARLAEATQGITISYTQVTDSTDLPSRRLSCSMGPSTSLQVAPRKHHFSEQCQMSPVSPALLQHNSHSTVLQVWVEDEERAFANENEESQPLDRPPHVHVDWPLRGTRPITPPPEFSRAPPPRTVSLTRGTLPPRIADPMPQPPLTRAPLKSKSPRRMGAKGTEGADALSGANTSHSPLLRRSKSSAHTQPSAKAPPSMPLAPFQEVSTESEEGSNHGYLRIRSPGPRSRKQTSSPHYPSHSSLPPRDCHVAETGPLWGSSRDVTPTDVRWKPEGLSIYTEPADVAEADQSSRSALPPKTPVPPKSPILRTASIVLGTLSFGGARELKKAVTAPAESSTRQKRSNSRRQQPSMPTLPMSSSEGGSNAVVAAKRAMAKAKIPPERTSLPAGKDWCSYDLSSHSKQSDSGKREGGRVETEVWDRPKTADGLRMKGGAAHSYGLAPSGGSVPERPGWKPSVLTNGSTERMAVRDRPRTAGSQRPRASSPLPEELSGLIPLPWGGYGELRRDRERKEHGRKSLRRENSWLHQVAGLKAEGEAAVPLDASRIIPGKSNRALRRACMDPVGDGIGDRGGKGREASTGEAGVPVVNQVSALRSPRRREAHDPQTEAFAFQCMWTASSSSEFEGFHTMEGTESSMRQTLEVLPGVAL